MDPARRSRPAHRRRADGGRHENRRDVRLRPRPRALGLPARRRPRAPRRRERGLGQPCPRSLHPGAARGTRPRTGGASRQAHAPPTSHLRPDRPGPVRSRDRGLPRRREPRRLRQGRRPTPRLASLRRTLGPPLARHRPLRRLERPRREHRLPQRLPLPRLRRRLPEPRQALQPLRPGADRRRPDAGGHRRAALRADHRHGFPHARPQGARRAGRRQDADRHRRRAGQHRGPRLSRPAGRLRPLPRPQVRPDPHGRLLRDGRRHALDRDDERRRRHALAGAAAGPGRQAGRVRSGTEAGRRGAGEGQRGGPGAERRPAPPAPRGPRRVPASRGRGLPELERRRGEAGRGARDDRPGRRRPRPGTAGPQALGPGLLPLPGRPAGRGGRPEPKRRLRHLERLRRRLARSLRAGDRRAAGDHRLGEGADGAADPEPRPRAGAEDAGGGRLALREPLRDDRDRLGRAPHAARAQGRGRARAGGLQAAARAGGTALAGLRRLLLHSLP